MTRLMVPTTGFRTDLPVDESRTLTIAERSPLAELHDRSRVLATHFSELHADVSSLREREVADELNSNAQRLVSVGLVDLLERLSARGFAWRDIARVVGVSVPALRKWRMGGAASGDNLLAVARFVALVEWLESVQLINEPASWFEVPISPDAPVTRLDLVVGNREDLVTRSVLGGGLDSVQLLDEFEDGWREHYRSDFEVFVETDGQRSIRLKSAGPD